MSYEYALAFAGEVLPGNQVDDQAMADLWREKLANNPAYQKRREITVVRREVGEWGPYDVDPE